MQQLWIHENRRHIVCVDSYDDGVLRGCFFTPHQEVLQFSSLSQFLLKMEELLDQLQSPQAYTTPRRFSDMLPEIVVPTETVPRGAKATFELKILFRQHTSWQGTVVWREKKTEHSFRSVLELVLLLDSALRELEESGAA